VQPGATPVVAGAVVTGAAVVVVAVVAGPTAVVAGDGADAPVPLVPLVLGTVATVVAAVDDDSLEQAPSTATQAMTTLRWTARTQRPDEGADPASFGTITTSSWPSGRGRPVRTVQRAAVHMDDA
jgi:hypothetical protein